MLKLQRIVRTLIGFGLIAAFLGCASTQKRETTGQYIDDTTITAKVKAEILVEPGLKSLQITVNSYNGVVQLSGFVDSSQNAKKAGEIARNVAGVTEVKNDLVVK